MYQRKHCRSQREYDVAPFGSPFRELLLKVLTILSHSAYHWRMERWKEMGGEHVT